MPDITMNDFETCQTTKRNSRQGHGRIPRVLGRLDRTVLDPCKGHRQVRHSERFGRGASSSWKVRYPEIFQASGYSEPCQEDLAVNGTDISRDAQDEINAGPSSHGRREEDDEKKLTLQIA